MKIKEGGMGELMQVKNRKGAICTGNGKHFSFSVEPNEKINYIPADLNVIYMHLIL